MSEKAPDMLPIFEPETPQPEVDVDALAQHISEVAHPLADTPDSTDRWLADTGGGGRRKSLAADPPSMPKPARPSRRRGTKPGPNYGDDPRLEVGDPTPPYVGVRAPEEVEVQHATNEVGRKLVERARGPSVFRNLGGLSVAEQTATLRAREERKNRT